MSYNSGLSTATISGNVDTELTPRTVIVLGNTATGNTSTTIGTVGAGKVWKIVYMQLASHNSNTNSGIASLNLNGVRALRHDMTGGAGVFPAQSSCISLPYDLAPVLTAGQTVVIQTTAIGVVGSGSIGYIEESA